MYSKKNMPIVQYFWLINCFFDTTKLIDIRFLANYNYFLIDSHDNEKSLKNELQTIVYPYEIWPTKIPSFTKN